MIIIDSMNDSHTGRQFWPVWETASVRVAGMRNTDSINDSQTGRPFGRCERRPVWGWPVWESLIVWMTLIVSYGPSIWPVWGIVGMRRTIIFDYHTAWPVWEVLRTIYILIYYKPLFLDLCEDVLQHPSSICWNQNLNLSHGIWTHNIFLQYSQLLELVHTRIIKLMLLPCLYEYTQCLMLVSCLTFRP